MTEETHKRVLGNMDAPKNAYEAEMFDTMSQALGILEPIYAMLCARGFIDSEAKSRGLLLALGNLLGAHLIQHGANMQLSKEKVEKFELETLMKNIQILIDDHYEEALALSLAAEAAEHTKQ